MRIGIVGSEAAKFTPATEAEARTVIRQLLDEGDVVVSGACHLGGIDIWAREEGQKLGLEVKEYPPEYHSWDSGYKPRNIKIARDSEMVVCITVRELPGEYVGMKFDYCYHCGRAARHIKSGGCWTVKFAKREGKAGYVVVIG